MALASPVSGWVLDRVGRRRVLAAGLVIFGLAGASGLVLDSLGMLLAGRAVLGLAAAAVATSGTALIGDYFSADERSKVLGWQAAVVGLLGMSVQLAGGGLAQIGWRWPFAAYLIALTAFVGMALYFVIPTQIPFYLERELGKGNLMIGLATATAAASGVPASLTYGRLRHRLGVRGVFALMFLLLAIGFGTMGAAASYPWVVAGMVPVGLAAGLLVPNLNSWTLEGTPSAYRGRGLGVMSCALYLGQFLSPLALQPAVSSAGVKPVFAGAALLTLAAALLAGGRAALGPIWRRVNRAS